MENESEGRERAKWLTYLVYLILTFQTVTLGWLVVKYTEMPDKFVRLERYTYDMKRIETIMAAMNLKLDTLVASKMNER